jgi:inhibitor of KinA
VTDGQTRRIVPAGDSAFIVEFDDRIDEAVNSRVIACAEALRARSLRGVRDIVPTYRSVAVYFDPLRTDVDGLSRCLAEEEPSSAALRREAAAIHIPVCYGGAYGPDLAAVARWSGMTESEVVDIHTAATYRVYMLGFLPGFAYMGLVDERIAAPRHATPRLRVPQGSVGVAGRQTGIYSLESPGGWQLLGKTPLKPFDLNRPNPSLFAAGDAVHFHRIDTSEFERAAKG